MGAWGEADWVMGQDISRVRWPPFPPTVEGRGQDFKYVSLSPSSLHGPMFKLTRVLKASWFIANEIGVSSIPVSEVRPPPLPPSRCSRSL